MGDLQLNVSDGVAVVTLDRPPVNALARELLFEIAETFDSLHDMTNVRVALLTGAGDRAFCAGADIKEMDADSDWTTEDHGRLMRTAQDSIYECAIPVIGAINGAALGGGLTLAASCDYAIASDRASFGLPEINLGVLGGARHSRQLFPMNFVRRMQYTGESIDAQEAWRLGGVVRVVPHNELMTVAFEEAASVATKIPMGLRLAKESLNHVEWMDVKNGYRFEQTRTEMLSKSEDAAEARKAFQERRAPVFKGK